MLAYGIQVFHGKPIKLPRVPTQPPDKERLEERYEVSRKSA